MEILLSDLIKTSITTIRAVQLFIERMVKYDPESAFEEALLGKRKKPILAEDWHAEKSCQERLYGRFDGKIKIIGEEMLRDPNLNLSNEPGLFALTVKVQIDIDHLGL